MFRKLSIHHSKQPRLLLRKQLSSLATIPECVAVTRRIPRRALSSVHLEPFDAMKALLDTLHMATLSSCTLLHSSTNEFRRFDQNTLSLPMFRNVSPDHNSQVAVRFVLDQNTLFESPKETLQIAEVAHTIASEKIYVRLSARAKGVYKWKKKVPFSPPSHETTEKLQLLMNEGDATAAMILVKNASRKGIQFPKKSLYNCFRFMLTRNPVYAHGILCYYQKQCGADDLMYERLCRSIANLMTSHETSTKTRVCVVQVRQECEKMPKETQQVLLPILLESMVTTAVGSVREQSLGLYKYLCENEFVLSPDLLESLLAKSRYWSTDLPYQRVLQQLSDSQVPPKNAGALTNALSNFFPFTDGDKTLMAVTAVHDIVRRGNTHVRVDRGTLEQILAGASREGNYELGLLTWDLSESLGYAPTESLFESMIQAFSMAYKQDHRVFSCLAGMEDYGYIPSRALLRSVSRSLRYSINRIDNAYRYISQGIHGCRPTLCSLNVIMSACAECGDIDRTLSVLFDDFRRYGIEPNSDSFSFAMEALAVNARSQESDVDNVSLLAAAEDLLNMMSQQSIDVDRHVFREYIRVLINAGALELATASTFDAIRAERFEVDNKTVVILINSLCCVSHRFDVARELASLASEPLPFLFRKIDRWEKDFDRKLKSLPSMDHGPDFDDASHESHELES